MVKIPAVNSDGAAAECGNCGMEERILLHHVNHRALFRRLCTGCVLRLHPQSFCPTCFEVYPPPPPPSNDAVFTCVKCYSNSHYRCVAGEGRAPPPKPYICAICAAPNSPIFKLEISKGEAAANPNKMEEWRVLNADAAKKLAAAGKIASISMNKAAAAARLEAERRAREAAYARKRAKDALEHLANLVKKKKPKKKESTLPPPTATSAAVDSQIPMPETTAIPAGNMEPTDNTTAQLSTDELPLPLPLTHHPVGETSEDDEAADENEDITTNSGED